MGKGVKGFLGWILRELEYVDNFSWVEIRYVDESMESKLCG